MASAFYTNDTAAFKEIINILDTASVALSSIRNDEEEDISFIRSIAILKERLDILGAECLILKSDEAVSLFNSGGLDWVQERKHVWSIFKKIGYPSKSYRDGDTIIRGYKIDKNKVEDLFSRYCSSIPPERSVTSVTN